MKVLLIISPRYYWPFINEGDNFLLPQSCVCLASALREAGYKVNIVDCMASRVGWRSLARLIKEEGPDVVGVGESHALYAHESGRVFKLVKEISPKTVTVAGGIHYTNLKEESLRELPIDFIVEGEGEVTLVELLRELSRSRPEYSRIKGISYLDNGNIHINPPRPLISDLDSLPLPAYDLVPMSEYGKARFLFDPDGTTIHHSRGCTGGCSFCVWWTQMAERKAGGKLSPKWRTKSVGRTLEEIRLLRFGYNKRCLVFVDDSWNIDPEWNDEFAEEVISQKLDVRWFAFFRTDCTLRDERLGILKKLVRAGLSHISIGVERAEDEKLKDFRKGFYSLEDTKECFRIMKKRYPQVFLQATFLVGVRDETEESIYSQLELARELKADYPGFHPLTPVPGTYLWEQSKKKGWIEVKDFRRYDWLTPVMGSTHLSRERIEELLIDINRRYIRLPWLLKGLTSPYTYKRRMYIWWLLVAARLFLASTFKWANPLKGRRYLNLIKPKWYDG